MCLQTIKSASTQNNSSAPPLTVITNSVTSVVVSKSSGDREFVGRDERDVRARATASASGIYKSSLEERAVLAVEAASTGLEVSDRRGERAVASVCATSRQDTTALDQSGLVQSIVSVVSGETRNCLQFHIHTCCRK